VVLTGTQSNSTQQQGQVSGVSQVIVDPNFDTSTLAADAALLVLSTPTTVTPVPVNTDPGLYAAGTAVTIAGWGADDSAGDLPSDLQYGADVMQSSSICAQAAQAGDALFNAQTQLCAMDSPSFADGACHGDSGGPVLSDASGSWVEIGLTSFGPDTCETDSPVFYTRTDAIDQWVHSEITANPPAAASPVTDTPPATTPPVTTTQPPATATTTTPATGPRTGLYRGRTAQGRPLSLTVASAAEVVDHASFTFRLTCRHHRHLSSRLATDVAWPLVTATGMGFFDTYATHRGAMHFTVSGTFSPSGTASGTLRVTDHAGRRGVCTSGTVRWHAGT
jgi:secreted trypsin-like serine protease